MSIRAHSIFEITQYLNSKTSDTETIDKIIDQLKFNKLLDDSKFAIWFVESYSRSRPKGKALLARLLKQKGISPDTISQVLPSREDEIILAKTLLVKKSHLWKNLTGINYKIKTTKYLQARGFSWDIIERVLKKGYNTEHVSSEDDL